MKQKKAIQKLQQLEICTKEYEQDYISLKLTNDKNIISDIVEKYNLK